MKILVLLLLYNKTLYKHVTALFCLYLDNVDTSANHFRNAPVGRVFKIVKINETVLRCIWYWKSTKSGWSRRRRCLRSVTGAGERGEYPRWGAHKHRTLEGCPSNEQQDMSGVGALFQSATTLWYQSGGIRYAQTTRLPSGDSFSVIERVKFFKLPSGDAFSVIERVKY